VNARQIGVGISGLPPYIPRMSKSIIYIASDHRGYSLKAKFVDWLREHGYEVRDLGTNNADRCDVSDYAIKLAGELKKDPDARGILICKSGQASAMTANRFQHLRAALCTNSTMARLAREHNDANVLVLGAYITGYDVAQECLEVFLKTAAFGDRYAERVKMLTDLGGL
jgi:ribose 5-phosphate isomerase B